MKWRRVTTTLTLREMIKTGENEDELLILAINRARYMEMTSGQGFPPVCFADDWKKISIYEDIDVSSFANQRLVM